MVGHLSFQWISSVADVGEGSGSPLPPTPLIFRPNWGPKGWKNFFGDWAPLLSQGLDYKLQPQGVDQALVLAQTFQLSQFEQSTHGLTI